MKIRYLGHSCFQLINDAGTVLITDPYQGVGYEMPKKTSADIVTVSHDHFDHNYLAGVGGSPEWVQGEGIGECNNVQLEEIKTWHDPLEGKLRGKNTVYKITMDGITFCHMGDIGEACTENIVKKIGKVDVLLLPIGGTYTIDAEQAKDYIDMLAPEIAIPMHYRPGDGKLDIDGADKFLLQYSEEEIMRVVGEVSLSKEYIENSIYKIIFMERKI